MYTYAYLGHCLIAASIQWVLQYTQVQTDGSKTPSEVMQEALSDLHKEVNNLKQEFQVRWGAVAQYFVYATCCTAIRHSQLSR